ncbi:MAG: hypothetical protein ACFCUU_11225 [Cyclobacteriaceae bacterium]
MADSVKKILEKFIKDFIDFFNSNDRNNGNNNHGGRRFQPIPVHVGR